MRFRLRLNAAIIATLCILGITSCGGDESSTEPEKAPYYCHTPNLDFGTTLNVMSFYVENKGGGTLTWRLGQPYIRVNGDKVPVSWVSMSPTSGSTSAGRHTEISVTVDRSGLNTGSYKIYMYPDQTNGWIDPACGLLVCYITVQ